MHVEPALQGSTIGHRHDLGVTGWSATEFLRPLPRVAGYLGGFGRDRCIHPAGNIGDREDEGERQESEPSVDEVGD